MKIEKVVIRNFKGFKEKFELKLNSGINLLVGNNEAGKSTLLEAVHLALSGYINGRYVKTELNQYLFNDKVVSKYIESLTTEEKLSPPSIFIEIYLGINDLPLFLGDYNLDNTNCCGFKFCIEFDERFKEEYELLLQSENIKTLPLEYYHFYWESFARDKKTPRVIPLKSALIDSTSSRQNNGSDIYISRIVKSLLSSEELINVSQAYRNMRETFMEDESIIAVNEKIKEASSISNKEVKLAVELSHANAWESSLTTYLDNIPFQHIGKGEQCIIKTKLALSHKKNEEVNILLIEEPENHLSHTKLNQLLKDISLQESNKQLLISTHESFVANKLGLNNLIFLNDRKVIRLIDLSVDTQKFFIKLSGYDTLRLILCEKAILVEGDSDELLVQKSYHKKHNKLPIEDGIDVISVGTSFLRFLELAEKLNKEVSVVTDTDWSLDALQKKYINYLGDNKKENIKICFDDDIDSGELIINGSAFNYNTLEPKLLKVNSLDKMNSILEKNFSTEDELHTFMKANKTHCALQFFNTSIDFDVPTYIKDSYE